MQPIRVTFTCRSSFPLKVDEIHCAITGTVWANQNFDDFLGRLSHESRLKVQCSLRLRRIVAAPAKPPISIASVAGSGPRRLYQTDHGFLRWCRQKNRLRLHFRQGRYSSDERPKPVDGNDVAIFVGSERWENNTTIFCLKVANECPQYATHSFLPQYLVAPEEQSENPEVGWVRKG